MMGQLDFRLDCFLPSDYRHCLIPSQCLKSSDPACTACLKGFERV